MKNKKLLAMLAALFKIDQNVIAAESDKEDGDDSILKEYTDKYKAYTADELATLIKNSNKQYLEKADFDINEVPKALYSKIAAASLESKSKALAKEHNIEKYDNLQDLLSKIAESKTGKGVDEISKQQIETLKARNKELELEKETAVNSEREKYEAEFINRDRNSALAEINLDYEDDATEKSILKKQRMLLDSAFSKEFKVIRKEGKTIVLDKDQKPVLNKLGDPETLSNVMKSLATDFGFKMKEEDAGGRGAGSSEGDKNLIFKGKSFEDVLKAKNLTPNTDEADKAYVEWQAQNPK